MKKTSILATISGALISGALALAGPALADDGGTGHGPAAPGGATGASVGVFHGGLVAPEAANQIGVGIFTDAANKPVGVYNEPAPAHTLTSGGELPWGPIGISPAS